MISRTDGIGSGGVGCRAGTQDPGELHDRHHLPPDVQHAGAEIIVHGRRLEARRQHDLVDSVDREGEPHLPDPEDDTTAPLQLGPADARQVAHAVRHVLERDQAVEIQHPYQGVADFEHSLDHAVRRAVFICENDLLLGPGPQHAPRPVDQKAEAHAAVLDHHDLGIPRRRLARSGVEQPAPIEHGNDGPAQIEDAEQKIGRQRHRRDRRREVDYLAHVLHVERVLCGAQPPSPYRGPASRCSLRYRRWSGSKR